MLACYVTELINHIIYKLCASVSNKFTNKAGTVGQVDNLSGVYSSQAHVRKFLKRWTHLPHCLLIHSHHFTYSPLIENECGTGECHVLNVLKIVTVVSKKKKKEFTHNPVLAFGWYISSQNICIGLKPSKTHQLTTTSNYNWAWTLSGCFHMCTV